MRLIDADALKDLIYESWGGDPAYHTARYGQLKTETDAKAEYACLMLENIDAQPTIEAEPTKHGRWKTCESGHDAVCTNCRKYWIPIEDKYDYWFCPHCGARMDEVKE